jgi:GNAT superfamily N-acetyltransferase
MDVTVERVLVPTPAVTQIVGELDAVLGALYSAEQRHGLRIEQLFEPNIRLFLAHADGQPVGCGGVAFFDGYAEVKRMYTRGSARRRSVGKALLARLEYEAREAGLPLLRLETGTYQTEAIGLYERFGFRRCGAFGDYAVLPPHRIETSIFYEKDLRGESK